MNQRCLQTSEISFRKHGRIFRALHVVRSPVDVDHSEAADGSVDVHLAHRRSAPVRGLAVHASPPAKPLLEDALILERALVREHDVVPLLRPPVDQLVREEQPRVHVLTLKQRLLRPLVRVPLHLPQEPADRALAARQPQSLLQLIAGERVVQVDQSDQPRLEWNRVVGSK